MLTWVRVRCMSSGVKSGKDMGRKSVNCCPTFDAHNKEMGEELVETLHKHGIPHLELNQLMSTWLKSKMLYFMGGEGYLGGLVQSFKNCLNLCIRKK